MKTKINEEIESIKLETGSPEPLGSTWDGLGVNFAIYSEHALMVELCLFTKNREHREYAKIELNSKTGNIWHGYIPGLSPGQLYGYRVCGPYEPESGQRFNSKKLLLDPYNCPALRPGM